MRVPTKEDFSAAALVCQPFALYLIGMRFLAPPTASNWALADPILKLMPPNVTLWSVPAIAIILALAFYHWAPPGKETMKRALRHAGIAFVLGLACVTLLRLVNGAQLPAFIPSEENAGPGMLLSMTAGYSEELLFRLMFLPAVFLMVFPRKEVPALILTGLAFALLHAAGPEAFSWPYFGVRFMMPGVVMSLVALRISPTATVIFHSTTHLLLPLLFN